MRKALVAAVLTKAFLVTAVVLGPLFTSSSATAQVAGKSAKEKTAKSETLKQTGTIIAKEEETKIFICKWQTNNWPYKTTDKTVFRQRGKNVAWSDLKLDDRVSLTFHMEGSQRVADLVTIESK